MSFQNEIDTISQKFTEFNYNSTPQFTLNGKKMYGRVVSVYDGDTITVVLNVFGEFYKFNVRLSGIDTCEVKSKNEKNKELACFARSRMISLITNKDISEVSTLKDKRTINNFLNKNVYCVWVECLEFDKYGRILGYIYRLEENVEGGRSINSIMIEEGHGRAYSGGTKEEW